MKKWKILIVIMLLGILTISNNVKAETYAGRFNFPPVSCSNCTDLNASYISYKVNASPLSVTNTRNILTMTDNRADITNADYFKFILEVVKIDTEYDFEYNNENSFYTCNSYSNLDNSGTTTYADGTTSNENGEQVMCNGWSETSSATGWTNNGDEQITQLSLDVSYQADGETNRIYRCFPETMNDNIIVYKCPITKTNAQYISSLYIDTSYYGANYSLIKIQRLTQYKYKNDSTAINNKIEEIQSQDIPNNSKTPLDDSEYQDYQEKENDLLESVEDADITNSVNIPMDIPSNSFVWNTIERLINTNAKVFTYFLSILSIGIIKLVLGR